LAVFFFRVDRSRRPGAEVDAGGPLPPKETPGGLDAENGSAE